MSLIKCDECGHEVSDRALFCPHCGFPVHLNAAHPSGGKAPEAYTELEKKIKATQQTQPAPKKKAKQQPKPEPQPERQPEAEPQPESERQPEAEPEQETPSSLFETDLEERRRRNEKAKMWVFVGVFVIVLGLVIYFFLTTPAQNADIAEANEIEEVIPADTTVAATDSASMAVHPDSTSATAVPATTVPAAAGRPAMRRAEPAAPAPKPVTVKSLSEQAAPAHAAEPTAETPSSEPEQP